MTDTNTLAPCPFCGERAETDFIPEHHSYQIACSDSIGCTARITRDSELGAIEAWNCRAALITAAPQQAAAARQQAVADPQQTVAARVAELADMHVAVERAIRAALAAPDVTAAPAKAPLSGYGEHITVPRSLIGAACSAIANKRVAPKALDALKQVCAIAVSAAKTNSRDIADWREDMDRIAAIAAQQGDAA